MFTASRKLKPLNRESGSLFRSENQVFRSDPKQWQKMLSGVRSKGFTENNRSPNDKVEAVT